MSPAEIVADSGNVRGKVDCTTHVTTALDSNIFADVNDFLDDCTACATDN